MNKSFKITSLALCLFVLLPRYASAQTQVIAHRGYWDTKGSAQNSIASLKKADALNVFGCEFDVYLTADSVLVVNHDAEIEGIKIEDASYGQLKHFKLKNGEPLPTLRQYLTAAVSTKKVRLILEIKPHTGNEREALVVNKVVEMVKALNLSGRVDYISFSLNICRELKQRTKDAAIGYLKSDLPPDRLKDEGFTSMAYYFKVLQQHPDWVEQAHALGLKVNTWTVNDVDTMKEMIAAGIDYITTDKPLLLLQQLKK